ncbi:protein TolA [Gilliamella apis]|nr:protein TolA [Gilliamella apis]
MSAMSNKLNSKLSLPVIISILLHGILIIALGYKFVSDTGENYGSINGNSIDAIMIDPSVMTEQYQRQLQTQVNQQKADQKTQELLDKQIKELAEKAEAEKAAAEKAAAEKAAAEKKAKQKAEQAKKDKALNDLLGGLTSGTPSSGGVASRKGVSDGELDKYKSLVQNAISNKFINPPNVYRGKTCELQIQIAPDGLLLNVTSKGGDADLCREALAATKLAVIPKPASSLYNEVKTMNIEFQPK